MTAQLDETDAAVKAWILRGFREDNKNIDDGSVGHLVACPDATAEIEEQSDGSYGCDTGCEYARLECVIRCSHDGIQAEWSYGTFGEISDILYEIQQSLPHNPERHVDEPPANTAKESLSIANGPKEYTATITWTPEGLQLNNSQGLDMLTSIEGRPGLRAEIKFSEEQCLIMVNWDHAEWPSGQES